MCIITYQYTVTIISSKKQILAGRQAGRQAVAVFRRKHEAAGQASSNLFIHLFIFASGPFVIYMVFLTAVVLVHERMISFCPCLKFLIRARLIIQPAGRLKGSLQPSLSPHI
jgi:hypothetical protein